MTPQVPEPTPPPAGQLTAGDVFRRATVMHREGRLPEAARLYQMVLRVAPEHFESLLSLGSICSRLRRHADAVLLLQKAVASDPNSALYGVNPHATPVPGVGYKYCWTAAAPTKMLDATNSTCGAAGGCESWADAACDGPHDVVPAGNYKPDVDFTALQGAQLNGKWTFRVTDLWQIDNGFVFDWSIQFDSSLIANCSNPIID